MQNWHGARDTPLGKPAPGTMRYEEPQNHGHFGEDSGRHNKVTIERGNETQRIYNGKAREMLSRHSEVHWTRVRGASWQINSCVTKNKELDLVERYTYSKTEK
jgi:hypothetical protein